MTWSERQALAKKQAEEEEAKSRSSSFTPATAAPVHAPTFKHAAPSFGRAAVSHPPPRNFGAVAGAAAVGAAVGVLGTAAYAAASEEPEEPAPEEAAPVS